MLDFYKNSTDGRHFNEASLELFNKLKQYASNNVKPWVSNHLERYLLSDLFNWVNSPPAYFKNELYDDSFKNEVEHLYEVDIAFFEYTQFLLLIKFLNSLNREIHWNYEEAEHEFLKYKRSLKKIEDVKLVLPISHNYKWVRLINSYALERDSIELQQFFDEQDFEHLLSGEYVYLSLRLKKNSPYLNVKYHNVNKQIVNVVGSVFFDQKSYLSCVYLEDIIKYLNLIPLETNS